MSAATQSNRHTTQEIDMTTTFTPSVKTNVRIGIMYRAFSKTIDDTTLIFFNHKFEDIDSMTAEDICSEVFCATNLQSGDLWKAMQPLPANRTHTSLSVGDFVMVYGDVYKCLPSGWEIVS
jgi:hypothetical protein